MDVMLSEAKHLYKSRHRDSSFLRMTEVIRRLFILPVKTHQALPRNQDEVVDNAILSESSGWKKSVKILTLAKSLKYELYL